MRYYIYISDAKIDMLFQQIPQSLLSRIATELKLDVKVLSIGLKLEDAPENRYSKLKIVEQYILEHEKVGTINQPENYFSGTADIRWATLFSKNSGFVYFGGKTNKTIFGLGGSVKHLIGQMVTSEPVGEEYAGSASALPILLKQLNRHLNEKYPNAAPPFSIQENQKALQDVVNLTESMDGPTQHLEFLAIRLADSEGPAEIRGLSSISQRRVLLGSPLFVAQV